MHASADGIGAARREAALESVVAAARQCPVALMCVCAPRLCHCDVLRSRVLDRLALLGPAPREAAAPETEGATTGGRRRKRKRSRATAPTGEE